MIRNKLPALTIIGIIVAISALLVVLIYSTEPTAEREAATKKTDILVDVVQVKQGDYNPRIEGLGTVEAAQDISLRPRVNGYVTSISESFIPGGFVKDGDILLEVDHADYENMVHQMESALVQAESELDIELGRQNVAEQEYDLLKQALGDENKSLVLRKPQLAVARANVKSAQARLNQAKLDLERTSIKVPFDAQILSRNANVGSEINQNMELARLIGINEYWVIVNVPVTKLKYINFPKNGATGTKVIIRNRTAWPEGEFREGRVVQLIGALDGQTRLARILVSIKDPLGLNPETTGPRILVGSIVQTEILGQPLVNVFRVDRDHLREGNKLWLKRNGKLVVTNASVALKDKDYAYITEGIKDGDTLVTNNLTAVAEGIGLRTEAEEQTGAALKTDTSENE